MIRSLGWSVKKTLPSESTAGPSVNLKPSDTSVTFASAISSTESAAKLIKVQKLNAAKMLAEPSSRIIGYLLRSVEFQIMDNYSTLRLHLLAININGMQSDRERIGKKILPIATGDRDLEVLNEIAKSGYEGPIGILNHTDEDARTRLQVNLVGLEKLVPQLRE